MSCHEKVSRRDAVKTITLGSAAALSAPWPNDHATMAQEDSPGFVDAHSHIWTRDVNRYPLAPGKTLADLSPASFTTEELLETARAENVNRVVLIGHTGYYGFDNRYLIDAASRYTSNFKVVAIINDAKPHPDALMKQLLKQHVTGFRIHPWTRGKDWLDNPGMHLMWKTAAETRQAICCLINPEHLTEVAGMCQRYPDTRVVIDHFARIGVDGEIRDSDLRKLVRLARFDNAFVKISAYYALGKKQPPYHDLLPMIRRVYEAFGARRLMWASDAPYQLVGPHSYAASIALVRDSLDFVNADERQWLLSKTAEQVYFAPAN